MWLLSLVLTLCVSPRLQVLRGVFHCALTFVLLTSLQLAHPACAVSHVVEAREALRGKTCIVRLARQPYS